jgi:hypothetical protein
MRTPDQMKSQFDGARSEVAPRTRSPSQKSKSYFGSCEGDFLIDKTKLCKEHT